MIYDYDYVFDIGNEIYCIVYVFDYFVWDYLVGEIVVLVDFYCVED